MDSERRDRVASAIAEVGADFALLTSPEAVCYATGMVVPIETGPSPFAGGPPVALIARGGPVLVIVSDREEAAARAGESDVEVRVYEGYTWDRKLRTADSYAGAITSALRDLDVGGSVATEATTIPGVVAALVAARSDVVDIVPALARARAIKTAGEIARLRRAAEMTALGHAAVRATAAPGRTELEIFGAARLAWESAIGCRVPAIGDVLSGVARTASVLGGPTDRVLKAGDPLLADLMPRVDGYWGDTCSTHTVGSSSVQFRTLLGAVAEALARGVDLLRPGARAGQVDEAMRSTLGRAGYRYAHHSGHGIGTAVHEYPRIVPGERARIERGMVVCLEPGAYDAEIGGARLEWTFLVEADGSVPLAPVSDLLSPFQ